MVIWYIFSHFGILYHEKSGNPDDDGKMTYSLPSVHKQLLEFAKVCLELNLLAIIPHFSAGADPTIISYNTSVVNFYNTTSRLMRFEITVTFFYYEKHSSLLPRWRGFCKLRSRRFCSWFWFKPSKP
jgi:hypothetical protein